MLQKKWADTADLPPSMLIAPKENADRSLNDIMADLERDLLRQALQVHGSAAEVAVHFNVDRSIIFRKLKIYGLR
jgi:transcriptional regulator of aromatic amino acid metabolism